MTSCDGFVDLTRHQAKDYYRTLLLPFTSVFSQIHGYLYVFLCVIGVFANISIVVVLLRPAMRKSPFNLFLVIIALCDASLMGTYLMYKHVELCHPWYFSYPWAVYTKYYAIISVLLHTCSLWLTVNMAILRYLVLYRGSCSDSRLPPCNGFPAAIIAIFIAIIVSVIGCLPVFVRYTLVPRNSSTVPSECLEGKYGKYWEPTDIIEFYAIDQPEWWNCSAEKINYWTVALVHKLIPCVLLTIFMTLLVRMLIEARERRSRLCGGVTSGNSQAERTTAMLTGIVAVFLITELPQGVLTLASGVHHEFTYLTMHLNNVFDLLSLINSSVNFVLCALMSHVFRREFLHTFGVCCPQSSESHSGAPIQQKPNRNLFSHFGFGTSSNNNTTTTTNFNGKAKKNGFMPVPTNCPDEN
ncbi:unnamed protein product [Caenorhabditis angaria]|uniref:G-protein coupled receptors family 1 profile domain-containing protein n=1 Tax=Caenorhabditis angaria TaxID=860376 RepID=A0A9P1MT06_9PELO|nr:unnamed protein product [Caenorhabditis angaria]